jgi:alpha-galactosidase
MWTKSFIQLQVESIQERAKFANDITKILENYQIQDGVFGITNGNTYELSTGYFVESKTFNSIDQLIKEMNQKTQAVRITEGKFILGDVYNSLYDAPSNKTIFSIEFLEDVK